MDDWQVGDLAMCVSLTHPAFNDRASMLRVGAVYNVVRVGKIDTRLRERALGLLEVQPRRKGCGFPETMFRKIRPLSDEERASFLADLDAPLSAPEPSEVAPADTALNARVGHFSPLGALPGSLPGPSADDTSRHADGSGLLFNRAHAVEVPNG